MVRSFVAGFSVALCLCACAGVSIPYYGLDGVDYTRGSLLGPKPGNDLPFSTCEPSNALKHPCVVMKSDAFFRLKQDYLDTIARLKECESNGRIGH